MSAYLKAKNHRSSKAAAQAGKPVWERNAQRYTRSRRNLWSLVLFLLISIDAYSFRMFNLFEAASEPVRQILGYPPPAYLVSAALAVYALSAVILTLTAIANDIRPTSTWKHLAYRSSFYLFYSFSGSIAGHYLPVLLTCLCLYGLDQFHVWFYNGKSVREQKQLLGRF